MPALAILAVPVSAHTQQASFAGYEWELSGDAAIQQFQSREAVTFRTGRASLESLDFENGVIEFDAWNSGHRAFFGIGFRTGDAGRRYEYFYVRPHQSNRFDAMQYVPVLHSNAQWQMFPEYNALADLKPGQWVNYRLEIDGHNLSVFVDGSPEPTLTANDLDPDLGGGLFLTASTPSLETGTHAPEGIVTAAIANFRINHAERTSDSRAPAADQDYLIDWQVSNVVTGMEVMPDTIPWDLFDDSWESLRADHRGRVLVSTLRERVPPDGGMVLLRTTIRSRSARRARLWFGLSDRGQLYVNGNPIIYENNTYLSRSGRYLGVVNVENDAVYIDLSEGDNEIVFLVAEAFGGWGVIARLED